MKFYRLKNEQQLDIFENHYGETKMTPVDIYITDKGDLVFIEKNESKIVAYVESDLNNEIKI